MTMHDETHADDGAWPVKVPKIAYSAGVEGQLISCTYQWNYRYGYGEVWYKGGWKRGKRSEGSEVARKEGMAPLFNE